MDPNEALSDIRTLCAEWQELMIDKDAADVLDELIVMFMDLDDWLTTGGFRPDDWS